MEEGKRHYLTHTRLTLGGEWHDGYVVYGDEDRRVPIAIGLTMQGCLSLKEENARLAEGEWGEIYEALEFNEETREWLLIDSELGEVEADAPMKFGDVEIWAIGHWLGFGWETEDWVVKNAELRARQAASDVLTPSEVDAAAREASEVAACGIGSSQGRGEVAASSRRGRA